MLTTEQPERVAYWKSLLKIQAPVAVTLARRSMPLEKLVNLMPGKILQFEKSCDAPLTLEIDDQPIADCEVVKSGDRFGVKLTGVIDKPEAWVSLMKATKPS